MNKTIVMTKIPNIEDAYIVVSFSREKINSLLNCDSISISKNLSFFYDLGKGKAVEWEPKYGPLTFIEECDKDHDNAQPHFFYKYCTGYGGWSQLIVDNKDMKNILLDGDYERIFEIMKEFGQ